MDAILERFNWKPVLPFIGKKFRNRSKSTEVEGQKECCTAVPSDISGEVSSTIPDWFLGNCVKTAEELAVHNIPLTIREKVLSDSQVTQGSNSTKIDVYELESTVYEPLLNVISSRSAVSVPANSPSSKDSPSFSNDAVHLRLPHKHHGRGGTRFLTAVIERFAQNAGADLIVLGIDDFDDLTEHIVKIEPEAEETPDRGNFVKRYIRRKRGVSVKGSDTDVEDIQMLSSVSFQFSALLSSPALKRTKNGQASATHKKNLLVLHIRDVFALHNVYEGKFLEGLRDAIMRFDTDAIVISTPNLTSGIHPPRAGTDIYSPTSYPPLGYFDYSCAELYPPLPYNDFELPELGPPPKRTHRNRNKSQRSLESAVLHATGTNPKMEAICVVPISKKAQRTLFDNDRKLEESFERENIRLLQRSIRRNSKNNSKLSLTQPFAQWDFLEGTATQKKFAKEPMREKELREIVRIIGEDLREDEMKETILRMGRRNEALDEWCDSAKDESRASKWTTFPVKAQSMIQKIEQGEAQFKWEQLFLGLLINPDEVEEGWSDIALDPEIKEAITQLVHQPSNSGVPAYGILKRGRVGGALLYGPPGTGKTHLARVLARESQAIMICASAADIENKYVGETEKAIQALFNLGHMLSPCTIFIDEADALFRTRTSEDASWERSQTNQLLYEMDGLKKSKTPPFVLLATNFPRDLDHAVLRRVPSRIHIGLPSVEYRLQIFQICLRDETLDADVDLRLLAEKAWRYSGSDIQTVCVQAALVCDTFVGEEKRRNLKQAHFEKAFQRSASSVSKGALAEIKAFAQEFDPVALEKMAQVVDLEGHRFSQWSKEREEIGDAYGMYI